MEWIDRDLPATDVLLQMRIPHGGGGPPCRLQIDKLADGRYRAAAGSLFEAYELCRTPDLEPLLRHADRLGACRSFREVLTALQQLSELDDRKPARPVGGRARPQPRSKRRRGGCAIGRRFWPVKLRPASHLARWL
jgi:hypothetical protein